MKLGEVDGKKIGCTVSLLVSSSHLKSLFRSAGGVVGCYEPDL